MEIIKTHQRSFCVTYLSLKLMTKTKCIKISIQITLSSNTPVYVILALLCKKTRKSCSSVRLDWGS